MVKIKAAGFREYGPPEALEVARPEPGPGEVLLRVAAARRKVRYLNRCYPLLDGRTGRLE